MVNVRIDLNSIDNNITRNIQIEVLEDIKKVLNIPSNAYVRYDSKDNLNKRRNELGELIGDNNIYHDYLEVDYEEETFQGRELSTYVNNPDNIPILADESIGFLITPLHQYRKMNIRIKVISKSKSTITSCINRLRLTTGDDSMYIIHTLEYSYIIPIFVNNLIIHLLSLKNKRLPKEEQLTLLEYLSKYSDNRLDIVNPVSGDNDKLNLCIREAQVEHPGYVSDDVHSLNLEYEKDITSYSFEFNYSIYYEKPTNLILTYPILIWNTLIDNKFRSLIPRYNINPRAYRNGYSRDLYDIVDDDLVFDRNVVNSYLRIPKLDIVELQSLPIYIDKLFSVLVMVDENDPTLLFNIKDLPGIGFKDKVLEYLLNEKLYISKEGHSLFYIALYRDTRLDRSNPIILQRDGVLRTTEPMDIKHTYRVMFCVVKDLDYLTLEAKNRIYSYVNSREDEETNIRDNHYFGRNRQDFNHYSYIDTNKNNQMFTDEDDIVRMYCGLLSIGIDDVNNNKKYNSREILSMLIDSNRDSRVMKTVQTTTVLTSILHIKDKK